MKRQKQTKQKTGSGGWKNFLRRIGERPDLRQPLQNLIVLGVSFLQTYQLHYSAADGFKQFFTLSLPVVLLNVSLLLWLNLAAKLLLQKWYISIPVTTLLTTVWSVANFFVLKFHGSPLLFSEFANFGTAMNVIDGYRFVWERRITWLLLLAAACFLAALLLRAIRKRGERFWVRRDFLLTLAALAGGSFLLWMSLFVWETPKPLRTYSWSWRKGVENYGYPAIIVEDVEHSLNAFNLPEGYDAAHLDAMEAKDPERAPEVCPDIILILNETFYDLEEYINLTPDADYLEAFYGIDGAVYGRAIIPSVGGGTNNTEFELLTSCSMSILTRAVPFNYVNLNEEETGAPRYLKALGYSSAALHCESGDNYARNRAYPAMGFDQVIMGQENFTKNYYGNRRMLDRDNYQDMLRAAESLGDGPRFVYLLTYQNHGGWEKNDESFDTVHVQEDFGDLTDDVNEFLTSVRMSAEAFRELTEYYAASSRPTVICMLGDHAPSFLTDLPEDPARSEGESEIAKRTVPYVIWSNCGLELQNATDWAAAVDLLPMICRAAGLPTSVFQDQILAVHDRIPVRTLNGLYRSWDGEIGKIEGSPYEDLMRTYYALEYNALARGSDYRRELYVCPVTD